MSYQTVGVSGLSSYIQDKITKLRNKSLKKIGVKLIFINIF